jgi:hypothetical protein
MKARKEPRETAAIKRPLAFGSSPLKNLLTVFSLASPCNPDDAKAQKETHTLEAREDY